MNEDTKIKIHVGYWHITYWTANYDDDEGQGAFKEIECMIMDQELKKLMDKDTRFIQVIVEEGQTAILAVENINYMEQIKSLVDR